MLDDRYQVQIQLYPYSRSTDQDADIPVRHPVVILGGGPVGLGLALDLGLQGIPVVLLDDHDGAGQGSRAICFAKRTLEIAHRYGFGEALLDKGVVWNLGKVFHKDRKLFEFNLLPEAGHRCPAFINLQQPYFEQFLVERIRVAQAKGAPIDIRGKNRVEQVDVRDDYALIGIDTPDGSYSIEADWLVGCDGAGSPLRGMMGLDFEGRVFEDNFLIADITMAADFPTERWFWFEPWFKSGASALLHKQPDGVWRIDFQLGWDINRTEELKEENIRRRLDAMLGPDVDYDLVWTSIYTFQCRRMTKFRHNRVIFAGDSAHQVSPFGARGANSGMQDVDNLGWKLGLVLKGRAPESLLDSYDLERMLGADENILNSTRATDFITPKTQMSQIFRNAVLDLAADHPFARPLVNSGRLSVPCTYDASPLNTPDALPLGPARTRPGTPCPDAPLGDGYLLDHLGGSFVLLAIGKPAPAISCVDGIPLTILTLDAPSDLLKERYLGDIETALYLIRPDQHVAARWADAVVETIAQAVRRACGKGG